MRFWDSSALVPLVISEQASAEVERLAAADTILAVWWGTRVECCSAIRRRVRDGSVLSDAATKALAEVDELAGEAVETPPSAPLRSLACELLDRHPLRAADALQLAAAVKARETAAAPIDFVCLDQRLRQAAEREGFTVLPV